MFLPLQHHIRKIHPTGPNVFVKDNKIVNY